MSDDPGNDSINEEMRKAGYRRSLRWWLTEEQWELVAYMAQQNFPELERIRDRARDRGVGWRQR